MIKEKDLILNEYYLNHYLPDNTYCISKFKLFDLEDTKQYDGVKKDLGKKILKDVWVSEKTQDQDFFIYLDDLSDDVGDIEFLHHLDFFNIKDYSTYDDLSNFIKSKYPEYFI